MPNDERNQNKTKWYFRIVAQGFFAFLLMIAMIFIPAGRITYWQGWVFVGTIFLIVLISSIAFVSKTDLIEERMKPGPGTKWWDKVFYAFFIPTFYAVIIIASLDAGRFQWSPLLPVSVYIVGYMSFILSNFIHLWAMWINRFFSSTVRIQTDRKHEVVQDGPYRFVRHPGYVGGILLAISSSLVLGSLWALIPAAFVGILLIIRTYLEDVTLQKELAGYADYAKKVRYRLLPGIW